MNGRTSVAKFFAGVILISVVCAVGARAEVLRLPPDARDSLMRQHDFTIVKRVDQIPSPALAAFRAGQDDKDIRMANPKAPYAVGKDATNNALPPRQLQFAAVSNEYVLIAHARGTYALGYYYVLIQKEGHDFKVIWVGEGVRCSTFHKFEKSLKGTKIDDRSGYAY